MPPAKSMTARPLGFLVPNQPQPHVQYATIGKVKPDSTTQLAMYALNLMRLVTLPLTMVVAQLLNAHRKMNRPNWVGSVVALAFMSPTPRL